jgi:hypothetical protein
MNTTTVAPRTTRDLRTLWRVLIAVALPIGPILVVVVRGLMPYWTSDNTTDMVTKSLADPDTMNTIAWVGMFIIPPLVAAQLAIGYLARRGAPVLATIGTLLSFLAYTGWSAGGNLDLTIYAMGDVGVDRDTIVRVVDATANHPVAALSGFGWVIGHILGAVLLGIALLRTPGVPRWVGYALMISQPMHLVAAVIVPSRLLDLTLGWGLTAVAYTAIAAIILRMPNEDWDTAPTRMR